MSSIGDRVGCIESVLNVDDKESDGESTSPFVNNTGKNTACSFFSETPKETTDHVQNSKCQVTFAQNTYSQLTSGRCSQSQIRTTVSADKFVNSVRNSSTRVDLLEFMDSIWSVSTAFCIDTSDMGSTEEAEFVVSAEMHGEKSASKVVQADKSEKILILTTFQNYSLVS